MIRQVTSRTLIALSIAGPLALAARAGEATGAFVELGFDEARALAETEGKPLMIDFFTTWCAPCKKLDAVTWPDPAVQQWLLENVVAIKLDAELDRRSSSLYQVDLFPSTIFVHADGLEIGRFKGFLAPEQFLASARLLVAGAQDGAELARRATGAEQLVPRTRLAYANYLAAHQRYREAAEHYLWCFDEGAKHDSGFQQLRRGEVLECMSHMSRTWFRGKRALEERREAAQARLFRIRGRRRMRAISLR